MQVQWTPYTITGDWHTVDASKVFIPIADVVTEQEKHIVVNLIFG